MKLSGTRIRELGIMDPHMPRSVHPETGMSFGEGPAGYDIRMKQEIVLTPGRWGKFALASSVERFTMPDHVIGTVHDKSTLARMGLSVFNTIIEPGWCGWLTLELVNHSDDPIHLRAGQPIAQVVFDLIEGAVVPYAGKYQNQPDHPIGPIREER